MKLYKYVSPERLDIIIKEQIRFTQPLAWNDPFELRPFYHNALEKNPFEQIAKFTTIIKHFQQTGELLEKEIEKFEQERKRISKDDIYRFLNDNIVGLTLTENKENFLMWSHYASQHTGFVIELNSEDDFFKSNDRFLFKVQCDNVRPRIDIDAFSQLIVHTLQSLKSKALLDKEQLHKISEIFIKSLDWEYEKEWRLISATQNARNYNSIKDNKTHMRFGYGAAMQEVFSSDYIALFHLPASCITAIYFGLRTPNNIAKKIFLLKQQDPKYSHINLYYTKLDEEMFKLNFYDLKDIDVLTLGEMQEQSKNKPLTLKDKIRNLFTNKK